MQQKSKSFLLFFTILGIFILKINTFAATNLTFTAHPTNTIMGKDRFAADKEMDYYYDKHLTNLAKILLHSGNEHLQDIGVFYSWIGYDFDRSNLNAKGVAYANIKGINIMLEIYSDYNKQHLNNDQSLKTLLEKVRSHVQVVTPLTKNKELNFSSFIQQFSSIIDGFNLPKIEKDFVKRLEVINSDSAKKLLSYFNKFRFQAFRGQIRFDGDTLTPGTQHSNIFRIIKNINRIQDYAISDIIISNFSSIKQLEIIKKLKKSYNISNISTIPLMETERDVDYAIDNIEKMLAADNISQIMKAGSDDTKFSGLATSIINLAKLGYAVQNLNSVEKPIVFIGMGSSLERLGGPIFFRKMLANVMGDNETNRTIQGGEIECFSTEKLALEKLKTEISISKVRSPMTFKEIKSLSLLIKANLAPKYQELHLNATKRQSLNQIISSDTALVYALDNYQAGSRYKRRIMIDNDNKLVNNFVDLFDNTRAIDFQTTFVLSGIHPEFVPYSYLNPKQVNKFSLLKDNRVMKTYITGMYVLSKQMNPDSYFALGLPASNEFYKNSVKGMGVFAQMANKYFANLCAEADKNLANENYLNYSNSVKKEIVQYLSMQKKIVDDYKKGTISFEILTTKLEELNYKIAKLRNLLFLGVKV